MESLVCYHQWAVPSNIENLSLLYKYVDHYGLPCVPDPSGYVLVTTAMGVQELTFLKMFPMAEIRAEWRASASAKIGDGRPN